MLLACLIILQFFMPRCQCFLAYYDMDPRLPRHENVKLNGGWRGTAPYRKMVISYYHVDYYHEQSPATACANNLLYHAGRQVGRHQLIDVFYENKPTCL